MKNFFKKIKPVLIVILWITCGGIFVLMTFAGIGHQKNILCQNLNISISNKTELGFVDENDVKEILRNMNNDTLIGKPLSSIDFNRIEQVLDNNLYIRKSQIFANAHGGIDITIEQRKPILRIINNSGVSYYIDENNNRMPVTLKFTARVLVSTGFIFNNGTNEDENDTMMINQLFKLAKFLQQNKFFQSLTEQIIVNDNREIEIIPSLGNFKIILGDATNLVFRGAFHIGGTKRITVKVAPEVALFFVETEARRFAELEKRFKLQVDLKDDPQLKKGEMTVFDDKKQDLTKQVVGAVLGT